MNNPAAANLMAFATETTEGRALRTVANDMIKQIPGIETESKETRKDLFTVALGQILLSCREVFMKELNEKTKSMPAEIWEAFAGSIYNELRTN